MGTPEGKERPCAAMKTGRCAVCCDKLSVRCCGSHRERERVG